MTILRKALLGGAALAVMTTGAQADELTALKAQLEALQNRVDTMEAAPANLEGKSLLTFERGQASNTWDVVASKDAASTNKDSGFTVAVTPTADMPAPVAEVTVYGYVGAHLHYAFDGRHGEGNSFSVSTLANTGGDHISLTAQQSRFGIKSKIDTAIGQIRTQIEADFTPGGGNAGSLPIRLRHAVGHWDMTPNWTFTAGQYWYTAALLPIGVSTVDFNGALLTYSRTAQFRLSYADGPLSWAVAIENPTFDSTTNMPNIASYVQYDIAGGHTLIVTGEVADWFNNGGPVAGPAHNDELGWAIQAGANFNLADVATLTAGVGYGEGLLTNKFTFEDGFSNVDVNGDPLEAIAFTVGLSFGLSETTTFNAQFGYINALAEQDFAGCASTDPDALQHQLAADCKDKLYKVTANVMWQPVKQMRMGWEVNWGEYTRFDGTSEDGASAMFATWFFF
jgi:hypothetical protein